jgi:hypothetical protein
VTLAISRPTPRVQQLLRSHELLEDVGEANVFPTNRAVIAAFELDVGR